MMTTTERRRRLRPSARLRILGWMLGFTALALLGGQFLAYQLLLEQHDAEVNRMLEQEVRELRQLAAGRDPATGEPFGEDVAGIFDTFLRRNLPIDDEVFYTFTGGQLYEATAAPVELGNLPGAGRHWADLTAPGGGELSTDAGPARWLAVTIDSADGGTRGVFVVVNFLEPRRQEIRDVITTGLAVSSGMLVLAGLVGWVVAGRILRPIRGVTETARSITESDLSGRIEADGHDEVAELARTFNDMLGRLDTAFTAQKAFVSDAGHELRTPITVVRGHLELLDEDPDERRASLALVDDELDRMSRIVEDLLLLAKLEHPSFLHRELVELEPFTVEMQAKARALGDRAWVLDAVGVGPVNADPQRLTQAWMNLVRNAVEHTEPGDRISIGSARDGHSLQMWVSDTGPGIEPADQEVIFERFTRRSRRRRSDGAGLGLSIVRAVARAHGGDVTVASQPGQGSRFTITLPVREPVRTEEEPEWPGS